MIVVGERKLNAMGLIHVGIVFKQNTSNCHFTERPVRKKLKPTKQDNNSTANSNGVSKRKYNDTLVGIALISRLKTREYYFRHK